jgi:small redox-active disulfide protein 2
MKIEVLGSGCKRCDQLYDNTVAAAADFDSPVEVVKVSDVSYFAKMGVFMTPGLIVDGKVISTGKVLSADDIKMHISKRR